jgi:hypothetical protein
VNKWKQHILLEVRGQRPRFPRGQLEYDVLSENATKLEVKGSKYDINNPNSRSSEWVWNVKKVPCDRYILVGDWRKETRSGFKECYRYFDIPPARMERFLEKHRSGRIRCVPVMNDSLLALKEPSCWSTQETGSDFVLPFEIELAEIQRRYRRAELSRSDHPVPKGHAFASGKREK